MTDPESPFYLGLCRNIKDDVCYINQAVGKNTLSKFVKTLCDKTGVDGRKTNHSARKNTITSLVHAGVLPIQVMQTSGHKNVQSINNYSSASTEQQTQMSKILSDVAIGNDDNPVNDEYSLVGNFNISDACDDIIHVFGNALEKIEYIENLQNFKVPQFCHSNYKGKPLSMFHGATNTGNVTISFS